MSSESSARRGGPRQPLLLGLVALLVLGVVATLLVVGTGREQAGRPVATGDPTVWQGIDVAAGEDGVPAATTALRAFAYLFGDLPGVARPPGRPDPDGFTVSGSGAVRWVLGRWPELTPGQQRAVATLVAPVEPPRLRQGDRDRARPVLRAEIDRLVAEIGARLGGLTLPAPELHLVDVERSSGGNPVRAWAMVLAEGESIAPDGDGPLLTTTGGPAATCSIYVPPSLWRAAGGGVSADARATLAHEIVHCYQGFTHPQLAAFRTAPAWVIEGGAEFAGTDVAGRAAGTPNNWHYYLTQRAPLFERTYSAMGWWFHVQHVGHDPWRVFRAIWAGAADNLTAYVLAGGDQDDGYDTWGASLLREADYGQSWEVHGVDVGSDTPTRDRLAAEGGSLSVAAFDARAAEITVGSPPGGADLVVLVTANQPIRLHDSGRFEDVHSTEGDYCVGAECVCPRDTERAGERIQRVEAPLWLGVSGGETGTAVTTDTMTLEEYCRAKPPERRRPDPAPAPPGGTAPHAPPANPHSRSPRDDAPEAGSNGDPHLTTFDGRTYGFQAGGEFTLARADTGDLEVQARQEPFRDESGTEDLSVAVNTAVAAAVGDDRVTVTAAPGRPVVRVDGTAVEPRDEQALPDGGSLAPEAGGYRITWPDGSRLTVVPIGSYGLNLALRPAAGRRGALHGLLGPFEGVPGNPAMVTRDGRRYPSVTSAQLYGELGESWRVRADGSLFDYGPGESAATFVRADMPGPPPPITEQERAAADAACGAVADQRLRAQCAFDVAVTGEAAFVLGYQAVAELTATSGGGVAVGERVGPAELAEGETRTYTIDGDRTDLYFATEADCAEATGVFWRVTGPDGEESLSVSMCEDVGRRSSAGSGAWTVQVSVPPGAGTGGTFAFRAVAAGERREFAMTPPAEKSGTLSGAGAEDRHRFDGLAGDTVTVESTVDCADSGPLYWGLEDPNGFVLTLRTPACEDLGTQTLTADGRWAIVVFHHGADPAGYDYGFAFTLG